MIARAFLHPRVALSAVWAAFGLVTTQLQAEPGPPGPPVFHMTPIEAPAEPDAIPLLAGEPAGSASKHLKEVWTSDDGDRSVRNVSRPTLTPVLPSAGTATGTAVILAPGGAFMSLSIDNEGVKVAQWLRQRGITAFILKYRLIETPSDSAGFQKMIVERIGKDMVDRSRAIQVQVPPQSLTDASEAVRFVRANAARWHIDAHRVGLVGFSAGAALALRLAVAPDSAARPDFIATIYGPMQRLEVPADAPPMFSVLAADDPLFAGRSDGLGVIEGWLAAKRPVEFHLYARGGHGFGLKTQGTSSDGWIEALFAWMRASGLLSSAAAHGAAPGS